MPVRRSTSVTRPVRSLPDRLSVATLSNFRKARAERRIRIPTRRRRLWRISICKGMVWCMPRIPLATWEWGSSARSHPSPSWIKDRSTWPCNAGIARVCHGNGSGRHQKQGHCSAPSQQHQKHRKLLGTVQAGTRLSAAGLTLKYRSWGALANSRGQRCQSVSIR